MKNHNFKFKVLTSESNLLNAKVFSDLSSDLQMAFQDSSLNVPKDSKITDMPVDNERRMILETEDTIFAFRLTVEKDRNSQNEIVKVYADTVSGYSSILWDHTIFSTGLYNMDTNEEFFYSLRERSSQLNRKQRQKWDFFFRPDVKKIERRYDSKIKRFRKDYENNQEIYNTSQIIVLSVVVLAVLLALGDNLGYSLIILLVGLILIPRLSSKVEINLSKQKQLLLRSKKFLEVYIAEKEKVFDQLGDIDIPQPEQISRWFKEEIDMLQADALQRYLIGEDYNDEILRNYAIFQPGFQKIVENFPEEKKFFFGFRRVGEHVLSSGSFIVCLFQTDDKICLSTCFYDFINEIKYNENHLEYHYSDLVGIAITSTVIKNPFDDTSNENKEVNTIWVSFTDSNKIEIVIVDSKVTQGIEERIKQNEEEILDLDSLVDEDLKDINDLDLNMNVAQGIVRHIQTRKAAIKLNR